MDIPFQESPNQNARPTGVIPDLIVVHGSDGSDEGDREWIMDPNADVSYHVHVGRNGSLVQFVMDEKRAWHAGESSWEGRDGCNDYSLGLGFSCYPEEDVTPAALRAGALVICEWMRLWDIPMKRIVSHAMVSPGRKDDPWLQFRWGELFGWIVHVRQLSLASAA